MELERVFVGVALELVDMLEGVHEILEDLDSDDKPDTEGSD